MENTYKKHKNDVFFCHVPRIPKIRVLGHKVCPVAHSLTAVVKACPLPLCNHPEETVEHHLFYCTKLKDLRERFLPSQPDTQNTLFGTVSQLKNTCHTSCRMAKKKMLYIVINWNIDLAKLLMCILSSVHLLCQIFLVFFF